MSRIRGFLAEVASPIVKVGATALAAETGPLAPVIGNAAGEAAKKIIAGDHPKAKLDSPSA